MSSRYKMNPRHQLYVNWFIVLASIVYLILQQEILLSTWTSLIESPYWIIEKITLGINLAIIYVLALFPVKWIYYIPFKIAYRWALEDILFVMIGVMLIDHLKTDLIIFLSMKVRSYNKTIATLFATIGALGFIASFFVYLLKGVIALVKKVFINTIYSKLKIFVFKTLPLIFAFMTSVFPFITGIFETIFQFIVLDGIMKWLAKYNWIQKAFSIIIDFKNKIDNCGRKVRIYIYRRIRKKIVMWAKNRARSIRLHTLKLRSVNEDETYESLTLRLAKEKEEKKKLKEEKKKTLGWKIQSYTVSILILLYVVYFIWVAYDIHSIAIHTWFFSVYSWMSNLASSV